MKYQDNIFLDWSFICWINLIKYRSYTHSNFGWKIEKIVAFICILNIIAIRHINFTNYIGWDWSSHDNCVIFTLAETEVAMTTVISSHVKDKSYLYWIRNVCHRKNPLAGVCIINNSLSTWKNYVPGWREELWEYNRKSAKVGKKG